MINHHNYIICKYILNFFASSAFNILLPTYNVGPFLLLLLASATVAIPFNNMFLVLWIVGMKVLEVLHILVQQPSIR